MPPRAQFDASHRSWLSLEYIRRRSNDKKQSFWDELLLDFQVEFPGVRVPSARGVRDMLKGFKNTGTVLNRNSLNSPGAGHSGRRRTVRTDANKQRLKAVLDRDSTKKIGDATKSPVSSARRNALQIGKSSFSRIVKELRYHPYKVVRRHELKPGDFVKRRNFCNWFLALPNAEQLNMLVSDEANFLLSGHVNSHNVVRYSLDRQGRPEQHATEKVAYSPKLMAFCGMRSQSFIIHCSEIALQK